MRKVFLVTTILALSFSFLIGCESTKTNTNNEPNKQNTMINNQPIDYKGAAQDALKKVDELNIKDEEKRKWIIRTFIDGKVLGKNYSDAEIMQTAEERMNKSKKWFELAEQYGVNVTDEELNKNLEENYQLGKDIPQMKEFAEGLGITTRDQVFTFDKDIYKKNLLWGKLVPILQKKYDTKVNNELVKKYNEELSELY